MKLDVRPNDEPQFLAHWEDLGLVEQEMFSFEGKEDMEYIRDRGGVYAICDFGKCPPYLLGWDAFLTTGFYDGLAIRYVDDDKVLVALVLC
jgi:hypothetical protein